MTAIEVPDAITRADEDTLALGTASLRLPDAIYEELVK